MGTVSQVGPKTEKIISEGSNSQLTYGRCEMQGWRKYMVQK